MEFKSNVGKVGCHVINFGELLEQVDLQFGNAEENTVKIPLEKLPELIGITWKKLQETFRECEGKELILDLGDSAGANAIEAILRLLLDFLPGARQTA